MGRKLNLGKVEAGRVDPRDEANEFDAEAVHSDEVDSENRGGFRGKPKMQGKGSQSRSV